MLISNLSSLLTRRMPSPTTTAGRGEKQFPGRMGAQRHKRGGRRIRRHESGVHPARRQASPTSHRHHVGSTQPGAAAPAAALRSPQSPPKSPASPRTSLRTAPHARSTRTCAARRHSQRGAGSHRVAGQPQLHRHVQGAHANDGVEGSGLQGRGGGRGCGERGCGWKIDVTVAWCCR